MPWLFYFLVLVPKNLFSWLTGVIARIRWPGIIGRWLSRAFVRTFGIDMSEATKSLEDYRTIEDVFTRQIKPELRPLGEGVCSPADGTLSLSGPVTDSSFVQAKGLHYSLDDLVFGHQIGGPLAMDFGWACTIYLAPHNYHRVHVPIDCYLHAVRYMPGQLWPVNRHFVNKMPRLFCRNERLVFDLCLTGDGRKRFYLVMIGAFNVGRISTPLWPGLTANDWARQILPEPRVETFGQSVELKKGDEIGTFALGSTVVMAFSRAFLEDHHFAKTVNPLPVKMGSSLTLKDSK